MMAQARTRDSATPWCRGLRAPSVVCSGPHSGLVCWCEPKSAVGNTVADRLRHLLLFRPLVPALVPSLVGSAEPYASADRGAARSAHRSACGRLVERFRFGAAAGEIAPTDGCSAPRCRVAHLRVVVAADVGVFSSSPTRRGPRSPSPTTLCAANPWTLLRVTQRSCSSVPSLSNESCSAGSIPSMPPVPSKRRLQAYAAFAGEHDAAFSVARRLSARAPCRARRRGPA